MNKVRSFMMDMIIMLLAVAVVAVYTYGVRALWSIILSVLAAVLTEVVAYIFFMKKNPTKIADLSAIFTGLAVALALPSSAPFWLAPFGAIFAIAVAKIPFGDTTTTPFVPAAVGIGFVTLSYPTLVFAYPNLAIGKLTDVSTSTSFVSGTSLAQMLAQSKSIGTNILNVLDVFVGRVPGPMGASCLILMIGTFLYLVIRRQSGALITFSYILTCAIIAFLFPRIMTGRMYSVLMELAAGLLFYCGVFFLSDPATSPKTNPGRILFGVVAGIFTMILRRVGTYEESAIFVVLIMNAVSSVFDDFAAAVFTPKKKGAKRAKLQPADGPNLEDESEEDLDEEPVEINEETGFVANKLGMVTEPVEVAPVETPVEILAEVETPAEPNAETDERISAEVEALLASIINEGEGGSGNE
ncbi:MAG: RnfABCDGE type electron transport complex subunit D [Oscillospiraceae bacterium]|nr:RnfABCDGE type electron transport complex subunit D [Candidatus Limimonas coprohippi]